MIYAGSLKSVHINYTIARHNKAYSLIVKTRFPIISSNELDIYVIGRFWSGVPPVN